MKTTCVSSMLSIGREPFLFELKRKLRQPLLGQDFFVGDLLQHDTFPGHDTFKDPLFGGQWSKRSVKGRTITLDVQVTLSFATTVVLKTTRFLMSV